MTRKKFIALCIPTLGQVSARWVGHMMDLVWPMNTGRCRIMIHNKPVAEARNECVVRALAMDGEDREVTHVFWVDDDVLIPFTALTQLLEHHRDIASGVYFTKCQAPQALIFPSRGGGTCPFVPDALIEAWGHGMGLTLVKADVYRRMQKELPIGVDRFGCPAWYVTPGAALDGADVLNHGGTEDLYFCEQASKLGYRPLVDCSSNCFGWHIDLKTQRVFPEKQFKQILAGEPAVWATPDGPKTWSSQSGDDQQ